MKKKICVAPVTEIDLEFTDGKSLTLRFDVEALYRFYDIGDGLKDLIKEKSIPKMCAKIIFSSVTSQTDFTFEQSLALVSDMSPLTITEIMNEFNESMVNVKSGVQQELQKKMMQEFVKSLK